jgi:hypothetical protein
VTHGGRDFEAERAWPLRLPFSEQTDREQDRWEADPAVRAWLAREAGVAAHP